jgi:hypothetical protein
VKEIKDLTPEQLRALETHYREWRAIVVRSGPTDRERVQKAIGKLYADCGFGWPAFAWYESPREMLTSLAASQGHVGRVPLRDSLCQPLRLEREEVELQKSFQPMLWSPSTVPFDGFLDQQPGLIMESLSDGIRRVMIQCLNEIAVGFELDWILFHDFCQHRLGIQYESRGLEQIRLWSEICQTAYWWAPYETICLVADRPTAICLDQRERLHSLRGPAMAFGDGWSLYAIHGSAVSEGLVMNPDAVKLEDLPLDSDLEVLHATIDLLGHQRFLKAANAKLIHEDNFGKLHRVRFFDMEPLLLVEVINSTPEPNGTVNHHLLRVPPETETAHGAVAWTFGRRAIDYEPEVET